MAGDEADAYTAIKAAFTKGDVWGVLDTLPGVKAADGRVAVPDDWPAFARNAVRLFKLMQDAADALKDTKPKKGQPERWLRLHAILEDETARLCGAYAEWGKANPEKFDGTLTSRVKMEMGGSLGRRFSELLFAHYAGWDLKPEERKQVGVAWKLIATEVKNLTPPG